MPPAYSGSCAFRALVPAREAPAFARGPAQVLWLGPGHHLVHYPVRAALEAGCGEVVVVVGHGRTGVEEYLLRAFGDRVKTAVQAVEHGALQYLVKPVKMDELQEIVARAVGLNRIAQLKKSALALVSNGGFGAGDPPARSSEAGAGAPKHDRRLATMRRDDEAIGSREREVGEPGEYRYS